MRPTTLLCAIVVSLGSVAIAGRQTEPIQLSAELRAHLKAERFGIVTSVRGLPLGVRNQLETLFGSPSLDIPGPGALDIAEPGAEFQATGVRSESALPLRRLSVAGCSADHCLVYYERGGSPRTWHAAVFHWRPAATRLEWGGIAPQGLTSVDDVRRAVLSGTIKTPAKVW